MMTTRHAQTVNIRPGVTILSVLRNLNYKAWFALAEFVDNSLQSFLTHRNEISAVDGVDAKLKVSVEMDGVSGGRIIVRDNAAGIRESDYERAFRPGDAPPDRSGLSEFGMGMKSAACWFANRFSIRTTALDEPIERTVTFDIDSIVRQQLEDLDVRVESVPHDWHYTEITLSNLHKLPQGATVAKMKKHLASIYREFLRQGVLELSFNGETLSYTEPPVLVTPYYRERDSGGEARTWRKEVDLDLGLGLRAHGFVAIRQTASTAEAGLALFRRSRLIQGSADETYRPKYIFEDPNGYVYQRVFGELHLEGFDVSHTKDGFRWDEHEQPFLELLKEHIDSEPLRLLDQARGYRARLAAADLKKGADQAAQQTAEVLQREIPPILEQQLASHEESQPPPESLQPAAVATERVIDVALNDCRWRIILELSADPAVGDWLSVSDQSPEGDAPSTNEGVRIVKLRMSLVHPFMERFGGAESVRIEPLLRVAAALGLAEIAARDSGVRGAGTVRDNVNELLRYALAKP